MTLFYLHGFASSPASSKASYFRERLAGHGIALHCPDFNEPDFRTLTMTRMLKQLGDVLAEGAPSGAALVGSSLGARLAILAAARFPQAVDRLILLAPAVIAADTFLPPDRMAAWKREGTAMFVHHAGGERLLDYAFYEDLAADDVWEAEFNQPAIAFQGLRDTSVDHHVVEDFASTRPNVSLTLLDDEHQLLGSLPRIWSEVEAFLGLR